METKIKSIRQGFSLIEVILAIAILSIGLVGIMKLASLNLRTSMDSRDEIVAASLAQDALEVVYNIKDNNKANNVPVANGGEFQYFPAGNSSICRIDSTYNYVTSGGNPICPVAALSYQLNYSAGAGFVHTGGLSGTKFFRRLTFSKDAITGNLTVTAYVTWNATAPTTTMVANGCNTNSSTCNLNTQCTCAQMTLAQN